jgi:putative transposase
MKKTRFTETQIVAALKKQQSGVPTKGVCREMDISDATFYAWRSKYGGMEASDVRKLKDLEEENARLKKMYADLAMDNQILKDLFSKKVGPCHKKAADRGVGTGTWCPGEQGLQIDVNTKITVLL